MFTVYENEINIIKSKKQNYEVLKSVDIDKFLKELEDSFFILKTMPSLYQTKYNLLRSQIFYLYSPNLNRIRFEQIFIDFIDFKEHIDEFASLIKNKQYQDIIREETKDKFLIAFVGALGFLVGLYAAISILTPFIDVVIVVAAVVVLLCTLVGSASLYLIFSEINKYELALTNDVKNLTAPVKNNPCFFDRCYDKSAAESNNEISNSIGNLEL